MKIIPFNDTFFICILFCLLIFLTITFFFKDKSEKTRKIVLLSYCGLNLILFIIYKINLSTNPATLVDKGYVFNIWEELPLHLCNISLFLVPISVLINNKKLLSYGFYIAPLGAIMAVCFPDPSFIGESIFEFYNIGYYFTHLNIVIVGLLLVSLKLFNPTFKQLLFLNIYAGCIGVSMHFVNLLLRTLTSADVNYFYTMNTAGISLLDLFWSIIPVPLLYLVFALAILNAYAALVTLPFHLYIKRKNKLVNNLVCE